MIDIFKIDYLLNYLLLLFPVSVHLIEETLNFPHKNIAHIAFDNLHFILHFLSLKHNFFIGLIFFLFIIGSLLIHSVLLRYLSSSVWSHCPHHFFLCLPYRFWIVFTPLI